MSNYKRGKHSIFSLNYHLILVVKYRRRVLNCKMRNRIEELASHIGLRHGVTVIDIEDEPDHLHLLLEARPSTLIVKFICSLKSASSRILKKEFPSIRNALWTEAFWSQSYFLTSAGGAPLSILKNYVAHQGGFG